MGGCEIWMLTWDVMLLGSLVMWRKAVAVILGLDFTFGKVSLYDVDDKICADAKRA
jgi:hypothetical protein